MITARLPVLRSLFACTVLALPLLAGAKASVSFASAGCVGEDPSACYETMFDASFAGTGAFGTGGYSGLLSASGVNAEIGGEAAAWPGRSLGVLAAMRGETAYYAPLARVTTVSRFTDTLTILHPLGLHASGTLSLWLRLDGVVQLSNPDPDTAAFALIGGRRFEPILSPAIDLSTGLFGPGSYGWQVSGPFVLTVPLTPLRFEFGTPFDLGIELAATTLAYYQGEERGYGNFDIRLDALHTAVFGQIEVADASGPITGYTVNADSGFDYRIQSAVPEPQTWGLAALGLFALALRTRRLGRATARDPQWQSR